MRGGDRRAPRGRRRVRDVLVDLFGRPALLAVILFAFWGTLVGLSLVASAFEVGVGEALARLLPGGEGVLWGVLNGASVLLAVLAWGLVLAGRVADWRARKTS